MTLRILNLVVIGFLVLAAAYVYRIKFDSTVQAERLAKLRSEVRHERDRIAALRAEWGQLDNPSRIQALAKRYLPLKTIEPTQFDTFDALPDRPTPPPGADSPDPIGGVIEKMEPGTTGSIPAPTPAPASAAAAPAMTASPPPKSATDGPPGQ
jgi:hypothetical protein